MPADITSILINFEYDPVKSSANKTKHKIDFEEAQELWKDSYLLRIPAKDELEKRFLFIGKIGNKHRSAVATYLDGAVRIILVRRSRKKEIAIYEG